MSILHFPKIVADGLVFYFDGKNPKSYTSPNTYLDDLINKRRMTVYRGSITSSDDAIVFANSDNDFYAAVAMTCAYDPIFINKPNTSAFVTFYNTARMNPSAPGYFRQTVFGFGFDGSVGGWQFENFPNQTYYQFRYHHDGGPTYGDTINAGEVALNTWNQIGYVNNGKDMITYLNGVETNRIDTSAATANTPNTTSRLSIGAAGREDIIYGFIGKISQAMFYTKALSAGEVLQNYNFVRRRYKI